MNRQYIQDRQVIERYLGGRLSDAEAQAFEEYCMSDPEMLDELQLAERLREGLQSLRDTGDLPRERRRFAWPGLFHSPVYAAAASVLAAASIVFSGMLYTTSRDPRDGVSTDAAPVATRFVPLINVRGAGGNSLEAPADDEWTVLLVDAGFTPYDGYRATVTRTDAGDSRQIWQLDGLVPTWDGQIGVGLRGRELVPGAYEIRLEGRMNDWPAERGFEEIGRTRLMVTPAQSPAQQP